MTFASNSRVLSARACVCACVSECVRACVCVCVRERERGGGGDRDRAAETDRDRLTVSVSVYGSEEELARRYCFKKSTKLTRLQKIFDTSFVNRGRVIFQLQKHSGRSGNKLSLIKERWPLSQTVNNTSLPLELSHLLTTTAGSSEQVAFISSVTDFIQGPYRQAWYYVREPRFELVG